MAAVPAVATSPNTQRLQNPDVHLCDSERMEGGGDVWMVEPLTGLWFPADELKGDLDRYVQAELQGKVQVLRNQKREGLIRGRMIGAAQATGSGGRAVKASPVSPDH